MSKNFETVFITLRPPRDGDPGVTEEGRYRVEDDTIVLVDAKGVPRLNKKGTTATTFTAKLFIPT